MPTITTVDATWDTGVSMDASELRRADTAMFLGDGSNNGIRGGICYHGPTSLGVTVNGSDQVTVQAGAFVVPAGTGLGAYRGALSAATAATAISARNATNPRIDLIAIQVAGASAVVKTIDGTPGASPSAPALPAQHIELARINVPATGGGAVTVDNNFRAFAAALGSTLYVATKARLPGSGNAPMQSAVAVDTGFAYTWSGSGWVPLGLTVTNGPSTNAAGTLVYRRADTAEVNVTITTTAVNTAGARLFVLPADCWPPAGFFVSLIDTTGDVPIRAFVDNTTGELLLSSASVPSGRILRGSFTIPI